MQIPGKFCPIFSFCPRVFRMEHNPKFGWPAYTLALAVLGFFGKECLDRAPSILLLALAAINLLCASVYLLKFEIAARMLLFAGAFIANCVVLPVTHQMMGKHWDLWAGCMVTTLVAGVVCITKEIDIGMRQAEHQRRTSAVKYYAKEFSLPVVYVQRLMDDYSGKFPEAQFLELWRTLDDKEKEKADPIFRRQQAVGFARLMLGDVVEV